MDLTPEIRAHIDSLTHYDLLYKIRFAPVGDEWMQGEVGEYWLARYGAMRAQNPAQAVLNSQSMGW